MPMSQRAAIAAMIGLSGLVVMLALSWPEAGLDAVALHAAAAAGAYAAGLLTAPFFGRPGRRGAASAALGAVLATGGGAALGGALFAGPDQIGAGLVWGPAVVISGIVAGPAVAAVWAGSLTLAHVGARRLRTGVIRGSSGCP